MIRKLKQEISKNKLTTISLSIFLVIGLYLRTHFGTDYYTFGDEAIRDAAVGFVGAREFQFPLTGPFSSLGPFTFGPWYYYQLILSHLLIPSFWAPWISLTLFSLLFIVVVYKTGVLIQDKYLGLIAALLATFSIAQLDASRVLTNPSPIGFLASLGVLLVIQVYQGKRTKWKFLLWGLITGVTISYHFQAFWLLTLLIFALPQIKKNFKLLAYYGLGFLIAALPTLFFEANNHWITTWGVWRYFCCDQYRIYLPNRWLFYLRDFVPGFLGSVLGTPRLITIIIIALSALTLGRDFIKRKLPKELIYLLLGAGIVFIALRYYRGERSFGYLQFFHVYIFIFVGYMVRNFFTRYKNITAILLCILLLTSALWWQSKHFAKDRKNQEATQIAWELMEKWPSEKYDWYACGTFTVEKAQTIALIFDYHKKLDSNGKKISFVSQDCPLPLVAETSKPSTYSVIKLKEVELVDLSAASESGLLVNNWYKVNPKILSDSMTKWWFKEKP